MNEIYKYIDFIFKNIINSKEAKGLKEQIKISAKEKYEILVSEGICENDAIEKVISEIGTLEDFKAEYPVKNRKLNIVAFVFTILMTVSVGYSIYILINKDYFELNLIIKPLFLSYYFLKPFNFLSIAYIIIWIINTFNKNKLEISKKAIRVPSLIFCICIITFYFFNIIALSFNFVTIPILFYKATIFLSKVSYIFAPIGILLFLGIQS